MLAANLRADIIHHDNRANRAGFTKPFTQGEETEPDSACKNAQEIPAVEKYPTPGYLMRETPEMW